MDMLTGVNAVLIGPSGAGKTEQMGFLAVPLKRKPVDTDRRIEEEAGMSITDIFRLEGEDGFRERETRALLRATCETNLIVATGGGIVCRPENHEIIRETGIAIWLDVDLAIIQARLAEKSDRPNAKTPEDIARRYEARYELYQGLADVRIPINEEVPVAEVADRIMQAISWHN